MCALLLTPHAPLVMSACVGRTDWRSSGNVGDEGGMSSDGHVVPTAWILPSARAVEAAQTGTTSEGALPWLCHFCEAF